ncbi:putative Polycomb group protein ASXL2 isoform X2 [Sphaerodactylus townsendi]|uniref:putative Polycomb group protein ASXL2 isoform X2 n=1 Tax=Sphaerodactylus townsendi TaxID=933632 RepID=UPI002025FC17|nr:putative Polycomb group protein ASXL2 isoform X2 [Sphaerodactylus townsendi]
MREKGRRKKGRTWAEAARTVLEKNPNTPMSHKEILQVIQKEGLKEISGTSPLACLNAMLHTNSRGDEGIFYKVPGRMGVYTLKKDVPDGLKELSEGSEESSDVQSDSPTSENSSSSSDRSSNKEGRKSRWRRKVSTRLSQVSSPQPGCPSPSIPPGKVISSSQKHSKKALKQALKQKQRKQQQCRVSLPVSSNHLLLQQHTKAASPSPPTKPAWEGKQSDGHSSSPQNSTSSSSPSIKAEPSLPVLGKKPFQRSERLHARQLKRTKCAEIDVETPDSILVNTNLRALINKLTFSLLPADCQQRLLLLLPEVDRPVGLDGLSKLSSSALNNEFFTSAAQGWKERLSEGEFTPEMQLRLRQELEKEKKVELWKEHFFESYYGQSSGLSPEESKQLTSSIPTSLAQAAQLQQCLPISAAVPSKEAASPGDAKAQDLLVSTPPPAAATSKGGEEEQLQAPKPAELLSSSDSSLSSRSSDQTPHGPSTGIKEEPGREMPHFGSLESPGKETSSKPKSPAAAGSKGTPGEESQETPTKEPSVTGAEQMDTGIQGLKRKSESPEQALTTPEKRPHITENSHPSPPFQSPPQPFPAAPVPKVPPLRIPVSRIHGPSLPFPTSQVSPRPIFPCTITSPRRTGVRTLADIKARAQMARARRAAAAAEAAASIAASAASIVEAIPGPGPGGGNKGEERGSTASGKLHGAATQADTPDLADTGSGAGPRRPLPLGPGSQAPAAPPTTEQAAPCSVARTQLQPVPSLQPRTPGSCPRAETPSAAQPAVASVGSLTASPSQGAWASLSSGCGLQPRRDQPGESSSAPSQQAEAASDPELQPASKSLPEAGLAANPGVSQSTTHSPSLPPLSAIPFKPSPVPQAGIVATPPKAIPSHSTLLVAHGLKVLPATLGAAEIAPLSKTSSSIPANNPLVAQLLQGKEVPMEQILPKPLTRVEMQTIPFPLNEHREPVVPTRPPERQHHQVPLQPGGKPDFTPSRQQIPHGMQPFPPITGQELWNPPGDLHPNQEALGQLAREHVLQALMQRVSRQKLPSPTTPPSQLTLPPPDFPVESSSTSQSFMLGFMGRRTSKPAMSGHYLLNVSTYGRGSEHLRRKLVMHPGNIVFPAGPKKEFEEQEQAAGDSSSGEDGRNTDGEGSTDEEECVVVNQKSLTHVGKGGQVSHQASSVKAEQVAQGTHLFSAGQELAGSATERGCIQAVQEKAAQTTRAEMRPWSTELHASAPADPAPPQPLLLSPSLPSRLFGNPAATQLVGPGYSGTINVSTSPDMHQEALLTGLSDPSSIGDVVSFSVTVTTIPAGQSASTGSRGQPLPAQAFSDSSGLEDLPSKCYCRLKAMIMCKGCGAFCHDDCIGPSKLCVSCLVVR